MLTHKQRLENFISSHETIAVVSKVVLAAVALLALTAVAATAPNVLSLLGNTIPKRKAQNAFYGLKRRGLVEFISEKDGKETVKLTIKGRSKVKEMDLDAITIKMPKKWDEKWRIVIFDIPNRHTAAREALREKLKELGFCSLQKSVWAYPYPCEEEILFVENAFEVLPFVEILEASVLVNENKLIKSFDLV